MKRLSQESQNLTELYEAFDTITEDFEELDRTRLALLGLNSLPKHGAPVLSEEDRKAVSEMVEEEARPIYDRLRYALASVAGSDVINFDFRTAHREYVSLEDDEEAMRERSERARKYEAVLRSYMLNPKQFVAGRPYENLRSFDTQQPLKVVPLAAKKGFWRDVQLYGGKKDPSGSGEWFSLASPRVVGHVSHDSEEEARYKVIERFPVAEIDPSHDGVSKVKYRMSNTENLEAPHIAEVGNNELYRLSDDGKWVELVMPIGRASIIDSLDGFDGVISRAQDGDSTAQVILEATGADQPNVFTRFEDLHGDPRPVSVAKTQ